jgi:hypothetical protein
MLLIDPAFAGTLTSKMINCIHCNCYIFEGDINYHTIEPPRNPEHFPVAERPPICESCKVGMEHPNRVLPMVFKVDELPGWIIASDTAAFSPKHHPTSPNVIWIRNGITGYKYFTTMLHEVGHWVIDKTGGDIHDKDVRQEKYDALCVKYLTK